MNSRLVLRRAVDSDSEKLAQLNQQTFRETQIDGFGVKYGEDNLQSYFRSSVSPESFSKKIADPRQAVWVVQDKVNGDHVAFASAGPCELSHREIHNGGEDGELYRLYVRSDYQGHSIGSRLMTVALEWFEACFPGRPIWLGVWSGNLKAQRFYEYFHFHKFADHHYRVGNHRTDDLIMRRAVSSL